MKCSEFEKSKPRHHMNLENIDKALHDLGMLSAITEARREYLRESRSTNLGVMRLNTRYVSNVTVGYCMKRSTNKNRLCPYVLPVRHRTKSENSDVMGCDVSEASCEFKYNMLEPSTSTYARECDLKSPAKRCQSLENLNLTVDAPPKPEISPDMDCVSTRIQKLQVDE
ncbi:uncharacterized protein LOC120631068 [Pararge aegeria]|uniref:Jg7298 protein n=1 Tax=Pararge aegeria aegeria TaxID=348720 RepID=A0A8S4RH23_9NEOP|nr:uncharacterized protein LOC120631068 [Pararge aegeria]CAH2236006.1 jg7298 [Pararge aegeria aegeria]